jgi:hypothetical protein
MKEIQEYIGTVVTGILLKDHSITIEVYRRQEHGFFVIKCKKKSPNNNHFVYSLIDESEYRLHNIKDANIEKMALYMVDKVIKDINEKLEEL